MDYIPRLNNAPSYLVNPQKKCHPLWGLLHTLAHTIIKKFLSIWGLECECFMDTVIVGTFEKNTILLVQLTLYQN
jgi:hypothetical protein